MVDWGMTLVERIWNHLYASYKGSSILKCVLIGYGGLGNDVSREDLEPLVCQLQGFLNLEMPVNETYSFANFATSEFACAAKMHLSGYVLNTPRLLKRPTVTLMALFVRESDCPSNVYNASSPPQGLLLLENYINESEETAFMEVFQSKSPESDNPDTLRHRQVKHFGFEFRYGTNNVDPKNPIDDPIPSVCNPILLRLVTDGHINELPDQLTVNCYEPGHGIPPHVDTHSAFGEHLVSISCGAQTVMDFREEEKGLKECVVLKPRSVLVLSGPARYQWTHGIASRKADLLPDENGRMNLVPRGRRISFTFRKVLQEPKCNCIYEKHCDYKRSQASAQTATEDSIERQSYQNAESLEKEFVHNVYESIADHFSSTRHSPWPRVAAFLKSLPTGSVVADVGCGNGKYLDSNPHLLFLASDYSSQLCNITYNRYSSLPSVGGVMVGDVMKLPFRSNSVDFVVCIAVLHHLATLQRRLQSVRELARITRPGGRILITVWAFEQTVDNDQPDDAERLVEEKINEAKTPYRYVKENRQRSSEESSSDCSLPIHRNRTQFKEKDMLVPWHRRNAGDSSESAITFHRYYHLFVRNELEDICESTGVVDVVESYHDKGNWCVVCQRKES